MEKIIQTEKRTVKTVSQPEKKPFFKKFKIFKKLDEAFKNFDEVQDDEKTQYLVTDLPPVPDEASVNNYIIQNALLLVDSGDFKLAQHLLGDVLKRNPYHSDAIRWMGWCFKQLGDLGNALKCYKQLINIRKTDQDYFDLGEIYYELKDDQSAKAAWQNALAVCESESPRLFDLFKNLGNSFLRLGDLESAEENYNKAFTLRPQSDALQVNLGSLNFYKKDFKASLENFKNAVELNPYNDRAWCGVALVAREKGDKPWAYSMVLKSLDINPENLIALQTLVNWSMEDGKYEEAIERIQLYAYYNQFDTHMIYTLAALLFQKGDLIGCEIELERLLSQDPQNKEAHELYLILEATKNGQC